MKLRKKWILEVYWIWKIWVKNRFLCHINTKMSLIRPQQRFLAEKRKLISETLCWLWGGRVGVSSWKQLFSKSVYIEGGSKLPLFCPRGLYNGCIKKRSLNWICHIKKRCLCLWVGSNIFKIGHLCQGRKAYLWNEQRCAKTWNLV